MVNTEYEKRGHMNPVWRYRADFSGEFAKLLEFSVMNYNIGKDKLLGRAQFDLSKLKGHHNQEIELHD